MRTGTFSGKMHLVAFFSLALSGCGGGAGDGNSSQRLERGIFIDAGVSGLSYRSGPATGKTDALGTFRYQVVSGEPQSVSFFLGGLELGSAIGRRVLTPIDILGASSTSDPRVINLLRLLQTLDSDGNPDNGIEINETAQALFENSQILDFESDIFAESGPLASPFQNLQIESKDIVSEAEAIQHFENTLLESTEVELFSVSGAATGISAEVELTLGSEALNVSEDGTFSFNGKWVDGAAYAVAVSTISGDQSCELFNASGTISGADVSNVDLQCAPVEFDQYRVGGSVSGLSGELGIILNDGETLSLTANGSFFFNTTLADSTPIDIRIVQQPQGQRCEMTATGTINGADYTSLEINCSDFSAPLFSIGGVVSGLDGTLILLNNDSDQLTISENGAYRFTDELASQQNYAVTISSTPEGQTCFLSNGTGAVSSTAVTNVDVECGPTLVAVSVNVSGIDNADFNLTFTGMPSGDPDTFGTQNAISFEVPYGANVTLISNDSDFYQCSITTGNSSDITTVTTLDVTCTPLDIEVALSVIGVGQDSLELTVNGELLSLSAEPVILQVPSGSALVVGGQTPPQYSCPGFDRGITSVTQGQNYVIECEERLELAAIVDENLRACIEGDDASNPRSLKSDMPRNLDCLGRNITNLQGIETLANTPVEFLLLGSEDNEFQIPPELQNDLGVEDLPYLFSLTQLRYLDISGNYGVDNQAVVDELERSLLSTNIKYAKTSLQNESGVLLDIQFPQSYEFTANEYINVEFLNPPSNRNINYSNTRFYHLLGTLEFNMRMDLTTLSSDLACRYGYIDKGGFLTEADRGRFPDEYVNDYSDPEAPFDERFDGQFYDVSLACDDISNVTPGYEAVITSPTSLIVPTNLTLIENYDEGDTAAIRRETTLDFGGQNQVTVPLIDFTGTVDPTLSNVNQEVLFRNITAVSLRSDNVECSLSGPSISTVSVDGQTDQNRLSYELDCMTVSGVIADTALQSCIKDSAGVGFQDILEISDIPNSVDCGNYGVSDLTGIEHATTIQNLDLSDNNLSDDDFDELTDPIFALTNSLNFVDVGGNYDIRLTDNCNRIENQFFNADTGRLNCAGPDRDLRLQVNVSNQVSMYFEEFGEAYVRGLREHGYQEDTLDIELGPLTSDGDRVGFYPVRDGSSADLEFDSVRDSLECIDQSLTFNQDIDRTITCDAKQLVDLEVTLTGGGYDATGRDVEAISGIELVYPSSYPVTGSSMNHTVASDWFPGTTRTFADFPAFETNVSVAAGLNSGQFSAPPGVYCEQSAERTIGVSNQPFVLPCRQSRVLDQNLPVVNQFESVSEYSEDAKNYELFIQDGADFSELNFPVSAQHPAEIKLFAPTANKDIGSAGGVSLDPLIRAVTPETVSADFAGLQAGHYVVSVHNIDTQNSNPFGLMVALDGIESSAATLRPLVEDIVFSRSWGVTNGSSSSPESRFNDYLDVVAVESSDGGASLSSGAMLKLTLSSPSVDTYLIMTNIETGEVLAVNDDAERTNRSVIYKAVPPGRYGIFQSTYDPVSATENYTLTIDSSMPAHTYID